MVLYCVERSKRAAGDPENPPPSQPYRDSEALALGIQMRNRLNKVVNADRIRSNDIIRSVKDSQVQAQLLQQSAKHPIAVVAARAGRAVRKDVQAMEKLSAAVAKKAADSSSSLNTTWKQCHDEKVRHQLNWHKRLGRMIFKLRLAISF